MARNPQPPPIHFPQPLTNQRSVDPAWHSGADIEIHLYSRSLQKAAKILVERVEREDDAKHGWDVGPIVLLYTQAVELQLKSLISEGIGFLPSPTDHLTLYKTRSLRWLAQIVCQIIKAVGWEAEFRREGMSSLADFSNLIGQLEGLDPVSCAVHSVNRGRLGDAPHNSCIGLRCIQLPLKDEDRSHLRQLRRIGGYRA